MSARSQKFNTKVYVCIAALSAIGVILGKLLAINITDFMRFSLENLTIILTGIIFGPLAGGVIGAVQDLLGCLVVGYTINPIITIGSALVGIISGACWRGVRRTALPVRLTITVGLSHLVGSVVIKSLGLSIFYSLPFDVTVAWRTLNYLIVGAVEVLILFLLLKSKQLLSQINKIHQFSLDGTKIYDKERSGYTMTYEEALEYIHSVSWTFCKPGLERISTLCRELGNPQEKLKFVHVAGTNGKGSFCSMLASILKESGLKVGLYTSPYVLEFNERMRVDGHNIPNDTLARLVARVQPIADKMADKPTEFELITAIAFLYFLEEKLDVVVLECGLGGRLDSTNVITTSLLSVITGIALDHTGLLGDTVSKIAAEKAGIIKKGVPVLFGGCDAEVEKVIRAAARELDSEFARTDYSALKVKSYSLDGTVFDYKDKYDIRINLLGEYQPRNAALVLEAVELLKKQYPTICEDSIRRGLENATWPARFEKISTDPLILFDGAHNPQGIESATKSVKQYFGDVGAIVISGVLADKDYHRIAEYIAEVSSHVLTITPDNKRALDNKEYAKVLASCGVIASPAESMEEAIDLAIDMAERMAAPIICLGSLYTYSEVVRVLESKNRKQVNNCK